MSKAKQVKTGMCPKVGDTVVIVDGGETIEDAVSKVGTKYFSVGPRWRNWRFLVGGREGQQQVDWSCEPAYVFSSREALAEYEERRMLRRRISDIARHADTSVEWDALTTERLRQILELLEAKP